MVSGLAFAHTRVIDGDYVSARRKSGFVALANADVVAGGGFRWSSAEGRVNMTPVHFR
jgi:hypothetical protein